MTQPASDALASLRATSLEAVVRCFPHGAIIVFDADLRFLSAGGRGLADVQLSYESLEGRTIFEVFPPAVVTEIEPLYRRALAGEESVVDVEYDDRLFVMRVSPLCDRAGEIVAGMVFAQDVTDGRAAERALRESEDRFRSAFEHAPIGKALINIDGRYEQANEAMCRLTGYTGEQLRGLGVGDLTHPDDLPAEQAAMGRLLAGEVDAYTLEKRYLTAAGGVVWAIKSVSLVRGHDGAPLHFIAQVQEISERKEHEAALAEERRRLDEAQAIGHLGSWELDLVTGQINWSDTLYDLYGIDRKTLQGRTTPAVEFIHPEDRPRVEQAIDACVATGEPVHLRYRITRPSDGALRHFDARGRAVYEDGVLVRLSGAIADVTDQVLSEAAAAEARDLALEASRQKSAFLATMSHEIRTPMNAVIGMTGLLLDTELDAQQREFVETVRSSGDALLSIINDILDFSKIEAGGLTLERRSFDLRECVENALGLVVAESRAKGLELVGHVDSRCPSEVVGDGTRLSQVLVNLLANAVKFTSHGEVLLSVEPGAGSADAVPLRISVADSGIGIPADRLAALFDSYTQGDASTTRMYGGTGLGLAISARLVRAMGGALAVESTLGVGSTFSFVAPFARSDVASRAPDASRSLDGRAALVVDDNPTNRRILRLQLEGWGMTVTEAGSGVEALSIVASGAPFDLALLDGTMPGMSGHALAAEMRASTIGRLLPMVLLSSGGERGRLDETPFEAVLTKPTRSALLHETLWRALAPDASAALPAPARRAPEPSERRPSLRVLLAEDNAVNQRIARLMLEKLGHFVDVVGNGREAADAVHQLPYDVVLMDVEMPEMDGLEATRAIRADAGLRRRPQIVALTASALAEDRKACGDAGMDDYLAKPVRLQDLDSALLRVSAAIEAGPVGENAGPAAAALAPPG